MGMKKSNRVIAAMEAGRLANGFHLNFAAPGIIEQVGNLPFDFVYLDSEHGRFELRDIEECCRAADLAGLTVAARVPLTDANLISQYLNAGVQVVIVPHVDTKADALAAVDACFMEPQGHRPNGPSRSNNFWHGAADLTAAMAEVNDNVLLAVQIESAQAVSNLDDILSVKGIGFYIIGKSDLAQSYGYPRLKGKVHPEVQALVASIEKRIRAAGGRLREEVLRTGRVRDFILEGAERFLSGSKT